MDISEDIKNRYVKRQDRKKVFLKFIFNSRSKYPGITKLLDQIEREIMNGETYGHSMVNLNKFINQKMKRTFDYDTEKLAQAYNVPPILLKTQAHITLEFAKDTRADKVMQKKKVLPIYRILKSTSEQLNVPFEILDPAKILGLTENYQNWI